VSVSDEEFQIIWQRNEQLLMRAVKWLFATSQHRTRAAAFGRTTLHVYWERGIVVNTKREEDQTDKGEGPEVYPDTIRTGNP
jgi:hypothetical protein